MKWRPPSSRWVDAPCLFNPSRIVAIWYPVMSEVRRLPEFKELVTELNLVEYWRACGWADACRPVGDRNFECS